MKKRIFMESIKRILLCYPLSLVTLAAISYLTLFKAQGVVGVELFPHFDKLAHFLMYMFFCTVLWYEYYRTHIRTNHKKVFWGAIISPIIFSGVLEILQSLFTTYRTGDIWDFLFNTLGVVSAAFFAVYVMKPFMRRYV